MSDTPRIADDFADIARRMRELKDEAEPMQVCLDYDEDGEEDELTDDELEPEAPLAQSDKLALLAEVRDLIEDGGPGMVRALQHFLAMWRAIRDGEV